MSLHMMVCIRPEKIESLGLGPDIKVIDPSAARAKFNKEFTRGDVKVCEAGSLTPKKPEKSGIKIQENDRLPDLGLDESRLHLIVDMSRVKSNLFATKMEYTYFPPRSGKNWQFEMVIIKWPMFGDDPLTKLFAPPPMLFAVMSFPIEYRPQADAFAKECGLRIADGIPTVISGGVIEHFPLNGKTVFTLENITGHQVYKNDRTKCEQLRQKEFAEVEKIIEADRQLLRQDMRDQGYSDAQIDRILAHWNEGDEEYEEKPERAPDGQHRHKTPHGGT
jgi:hypothetical protein